MQLSEELFTKFSPEILRCEEVYVSRNLKKCAKMRKAADGAAFAIERELLLKMLLGQQSF